jgi:1-hydroxycarotenoid 3,4-desaturase
MAEAALREHRVVVVGAGIGGIVCALLLAQRGLAVTLLESQAAPGGKMRQLRVDGAAIDSGPTVFTMRWVFDQILAETGSSLQSLVNVRALPLLARHAWADDGTRLDLHANPELSTEAIGEFAGPAEARRFQAFCREARQLYATLEGPYIRSQRPSLLSMVRDLGPQGLARLTALGPMASLWRSVARHFHDPRLQQLFGRYATYCGASPWLAPATLMLIAQVEMDGVWAVDGGLHGLACALAAHAQRRGVALHCGQTVQRIVVRDGRAAGVQLVDGRLFEADSVVFNGDAAALSAGLLGADAQGATAPVPVARRSLSAVTWSMHCQAEGFPLAYHNVFFDRDYASEFEDIFRHRRLPRQGTVYLCAQDRAAPRDDAAGAWQPDGAERMLALVNAPACGDDAYFPAEEIESCETRSLALLRRCGLTIRPQPHQVQRTTPTEFNRLFPATGGALYGAATHGWMSAFRREGAQSRLPGLYLVGGSVHPGPGVPMAAMSGRLAAATLMARLDSTSRSRRVVISGGTSMPSATIASTR